MKNSTPEPRSTQELFDYITTNLLKQGEKSEDKKRFVCLFRDSNGRKCAVGWVIPDDLYSPELEILGTASNVANCFFRIDQTVRHELLNPIVAELQSIHDLGPAANWKQEFRKLANKKGLTCNF